MSLQTVLEKLQMKDEKNLLIQGLPSSIEKQFLKVSFAKSVTPLLKTRKIEFALVFAISKKQLSDILSDVVPALHPDAKLWVAYPKLTSKIASDLSRDSNWEVTTENGFEGVSQIALDNVWTAIRFRKVVVTAPSKLNYSVENPVEGVDYQARTVTVPEEMQLMFKKNKSAGVFFDTLSFTNQREYVEWVIGAKKEETQVRRLDEVLEKLITGKKNPSAK
jgi:hypothetical protein